MSLPPDLILLTSFSGDWGSYEEQLNVIFKEEIACNTLTYQGCRVSCRRFPETQERWAAFWHLVQEGQVEADRQPDLRRCERIRWVKWVIESAKTHDQINVWENTRKGEVSVLLWYAEAYLVVLSQRQGYWLLKTAYCTEGTGRISKLRKERDAFLKAALPIKS